MVHRVTKLLARLQIEAILGATVSEPTTLASLLTFIILIILILPNRAAIFTYLNVLKDGCHKAINLELKCIERSIVFCFHFLVLLSCFDCL